MSRIFATSSDYEEAKHRMQGLLDSRVGAPWTAEEDRELIARFHNGMSLEGLTLIHKRNPGGIIERLKRFGYVEYSATENAHVRKPVVTTSPTNYWGPSLTAMIGTQSANIISTISNTSTSNTSTSNTSTSNTTKESNTMTKPLEHKAFLFGSELSKLTEDQIIGYIRKATDEINSYASIPDNKYTKLRIANLQDAIEAAVKELNQRGE